jgi:DNA-binding MarR family transcriptional regulator
MSSTLTDTDYESLLAYRDQLRRFLHWSEQQAINAGITPAQYQLLLAVRGHPGGAPSVGDVADHLLLRHHSVVGLVDRAEAAGLVERRADQDDQRLVRLRLTTAGARVLRRLAGLHLDELRRRPPALDPALLGRDADESRNGGEP